MGDDGRREGQRRARIPPFGGPGGALSRAVAGRTRAGELDRFRRQMEAERDPYYEWFSLPAGEVVQAVDYPAALWAYETARRLHDKLGVSLLELSEMDPAAVELLDHIARCEEAGAEQARARAEQAAMAEREAGLGGTPVLGPGGVSAREFLHGRRR